MADSVDHFEWDERLQDWIDGNLDPAASAALEAHVGACGLCQARRNGFRAIDAALSGGLPRETLSADFDRRVLARIDLGRTADRAAARARFEQAWQAEIGAFSRQWRTAFRSMVFNTLLATVLLAVFLTWLLGSASIAGLTDQIGQLSVHAYSRPGLTLAVLATATSLVALGLTRAFGERA